MTVKDLLTLAMRPDGPNGETVVAVATYSDRRPKPVVKMRYDPEREILVLELFD